MVTPKTSIKLGPCDFSRLNDFTRRLAVAHNFALQHAVPRWYFTQWRCLHPVRAVSQRGLVRRRGHRVPRACYRHTCNWQCVGLHGVRKPRAARDLHRQIRPAAPSAARTACIACTNGTHAAVGATACQACPIATWFGGGRDMRRVLLASDHRRYLCGERDYGLLTAAGWAVSRVECALEPVLYGRWRARSGSDGPR
jgi:hypothetical protein